MIEKHYLSRIDDCSLYCYEIKGIVYFNCKSKSRGQQFIGELNATPVFLRYIEMISDERFYGKRYKSYKDMFHRRLKIFRSVSKQVYRDINKLNYI